MPNEQNPSALDELMERSVQAKATRYHIHSGNPEKYMGEFVLASDYDALLAKAEFDRLKVGAFIRRVRDNTGLPDGFESDSMQDNLHSLEGVLVDLVAHLRKQLSAETAARQAVESKAIGLATALCPHLTSNDWYRVLTVRETIGAQYLLSIGAASCHPKHSDWYRLVLPQEESEVKG